MDRADLVELHYITPISNLPSIVRLGILSHSRAAKVDHQSVAMEEIQDRRARVTVPGGRRLHDYANLYICGRNPMLYKRRDQSDRICVLTVSPNVLDLEGVVVTDGNASSEYVRFAPAPRGIAIVDAARTFADFWTDPEPIEYFRKKAAKCAEVLVPSVVPWKHVTGARTANLSAKRSLEETGVRIQVVIDGHLFFGAGGG